FRPLQQEIIQSVCSGKDTLGLLPTGGGKSVIFQVAALSKPGICIVVTPLIALMKDQVDNLKRRYIKAAAIYSGMSDKEMQLTFENCMYGDYKFLYISPERLQTEAFRRKLTLMNVNLIAIDESHCISQWGYDFRPSYLEIVKVRELFPKIPVLALTATATPEVVDDIQDKLGFAKKNVFVKSFARKNLTYNVYKVHDKIGTLLRMCNKYKGTGIVYVKTRRETKEIAQILQQHGINADFYNAGLDSKTRVQKQEAWMKAPDAIMVSTNAFGMGIDKPNVRFVVHLNIPESIEAYFQEAGRAGRDEKDSVAFLFYNDADIQTLKENFEKKFPPLDDVREVYDKLCTYCHIGYEEGTGITRDFVLMDFAKMYQIPPMHALNCLRLLESESIIAMGDRDEVQSKLQFVVNHTEAYEFQETLPAYSSVILYLMRNYTGVFSDAIHINEEDIARGTGLQLDVVVKYLKKLAEMEIVDYYPASKKPFVTFLRDRTSKENLVFNVAKIVDLKEKQRKRLLAMIQFVTNKSVCRSTQLLEYFGEKNAEPCGNCDACASKKKEELAVTQLSDAILQKLQEKPRTISELLGTLSSFDENQVKTVVKMLLDQQKVSYTNGAQLIIS
ncbi:MAG: RecQ family ATP-dependent DNA helicase, partial [Bacteroidales bacterium]|nr:RecQ family ATP-dependent DNA helicase [Bacteroidales bacterium]